MIQDNGKSSYPSVDQIPERGSLFGVPIGRNYYADVWDLEIYQEIAAFEKPVLIFHGTADSLVPLSYSERAEDSYKEAELVIVEWRTWLLWGAGRTGIRANIQFHP